MTLGDEEARNRGTQKSVLERKGPPTFPLVVEMRERNNWVVHQTDRSVDALLHGKRPTVEVRTASSVTSISGIVLFWVSTLVLYRLRERWAFVCIPTLGSGFSLAKGPET